jgi:hypothetical protein
MYNKWYNKQDGLFSFSKSYLHKGQWSPNEFKKIIKPFDLVKLCMFYGNIFMFYPMLQCHKQF